MLPPVFGKKKMYMYKIAPERAAHTHSTVSSSFMRHTPARHSSRMSLVPALFEGLAVPRQKPLSVLSALPLPR